MHKNGLLSATRCWNAAKFLSAWFWHCNYLVTHIDMFLVHYRIVSFPVTACQHPEMDAEYAPAEAERRVVFHPLPQGKVVVGE